MDIQEKAKDYAEGKMTAAIEKVIADAYAEGYMAGYKDRSDEVPPAVKKDDDVEFVDFGLPSGTLWAKKYLLDSDGKVKFLTFREASEYNLPTKEQFEELIKECRISGLEASNDLFVRGISGNYVRYQTFIFPDRFRTWMLLWLQQDADLTEGNLSDAAFICNSLGSKGVRKSFIGERYPVLVVKSK